MGPVTMTDRQVRIWSRTGDTAYADTLDHFENGLCRLMGLRTDEVRRWMDYADESSGDLLERLGDGWRRLRPQDGLRPLSLAISGDGTWGWLIRADGTRETDPPPYEEGYFEGPDGYRDYGAQAAWRLEKSARQVADLQRVTGLRAGRVLDVGAGYGFYRVALGAAGFDHAGLEISAHGRKMQRELHGFDCYALWEEVPDSYDAICAFDLIEHLPYPAHFLHRASSLLRPGGFLGLRTPNLDCPEREVFGDDWHSLKREHLVYFTPDSLTEAAEHAGFEPVEVATTSHLLRGFVGEHMVADWAALGRGDNLAAWYRKGQR